MAWLIEHAECFIRVPFSAGDAGGGFVVRAARDAIPSNMQDRIIERDAQPVGEEEPVDDPRETGSGIVPIRIQPVLAEPHATSRNGARFVSSSCLVQIMMKVFAHALDVDRS